jgi:oligopeptide transport system substrate-binding protein
MTADDFVWSWMRILTASLGSQYPDMLYYLEGAEEYHTGKTNNFETVGVKAIDEHTLKVKLKKSNSIFF